MGKLMHVCVVLEVVEWFLYPERNLGYGNSVGVSFYLIPNFFEISLFQQYVVCMRLQNSFYWKLKSLNIALYR